MKIIYKILFLAVSTIIFAPTSAYAIGCEAQFMGDTKTVISDDVLVTTTQEEKIGEFSLPLVGSFWRCIAMQAFPEQNLLFIEWHEGSAGTSKIFSKISLLAFSIGSSGISHKGAWTLVQSLQGSNGTEFEVDRSYRLTEMDGSVDIIFTGTQRTSVQAD